MKPIIVDIQDMSDSKEVYNSKPNPFFAYFIYLVLTLLFLAVMWMIFFKIDIVVKGDGIFRGDNSFTEVCSNNSGVVSECNIEEGKYVAVGDLLLTIEDKALNESISTYSNMLNDVNARIEILNAYNKSLDGDSTDFENLKDNKYYNEMVNRKQLINSKASSSDENSDNQKSEYQKNVDDINSSITKYEEQIEKLNQVKECVRNRNNTFNTDESYYTSIVESYISNYNSISVKYDNQIKQNNSQKVEIDKKISEFNTENINEEEMSLSELQISSSKLNDTLTDLQNEKNKELQNIELQQIANIEQQIETMNNTILSLKSNTTSIQAKIDSLEGTNQDNVLKVALLTEKSDVANELISCQNNKNEYENNLKQFNIKNENNKIIASSSGYITMNQEIKNGMYIQEGSAICSILPEKNNGYYANVYIKNSDIAKLKCGQKVKFEIAAYPSSEYGYFKGKIETISKDIKVDQESGNAYYLVKVKCNKKFVGKNEKSGKILNGMACKAKIIVENKNVLNYVLEKIDLID